MRLYTMQKRHFLFCLVIFFTLFSVSVLIGLASPPLVEKDTVLATSLNTSNKLPRGPFLLQSPRLSRYNQHLWLLANFMIENNDETFVKNFTMEVSVVGLDLGLVRGDLVGLRRHRRTRKLRCEATDCQDLVVMHLGYLPDSMYLVNTSFLGFEHHGYTVKDILFTWATYNPSFTEMEIVFRFFFLLLSLGVLVTFCRQLRPYPINDWSLEQRWSLLLLLLLFLYNNPLFPLILTSSPLLGGVLDAILQSTFLFTLLMFWLVALHGLRQTRRSWTFYLPKLLIVFPMWLAALTMQITMEFNEVQDPTYTFQIQTAHFHRFQFLFVCLLLLYVTYILFLLVKAFTELRAMQFIQTRLKLITGLMSVVILLSTSVVWAKFGSHVLEDNLIARLYTSYESGTQLVSSLALVNLYLYLMVYIYCPTGGREVAGMTVMSGDSEEEEVVFGEGEVRKPLNSVDEEESD